MKPPVLFVKACLVVLFLNVSNVCARDIISNKLPKLSAKNPAPSEVQSTDGGFFNNDDLYIIEQVNKERTERGLKPLRLFHYSDINYAAAWTSYIANRGVLKHATDIVVGISKDLWAAGENVGRGKTAKGIMRGYMASPSHKANILNPKHNVVVSASYRTRAKDGRFVFYNTLRLFNLANPSVYGFAPAPFTIAGQPCTVLGTIKSDIINAKPEHIVVSFAGNDRITGASMAAAGRGVY